MTPLLFLVATAFGAPLDPTAYTSLGSLSATTDIQVDTTAATMTGGANAVGVIDQGIAVFAFDDVSLSGLTVTVTGDKPFALLCRNDASLLSTTIDASASGMVGGPGSLTTGSGVGTLGGGGGFGGNGGDSVTAITGGMAYGNLATALVGGSAGGSGGGGSVGAGGGAVELGVLGTLTFDGPSLIRANGAAGTDAGALSGAGGGAGGGILVHAAGASLFGTLRATGGAGGPGASQGGGGGGGRVCVLAPASSQVVDVAGGAGFNAGQAGVVCVGDADGDGSPFHLDCDDSDPTIYPGATEVPGDGIDQSCNGWDADHGPDELVPGDLVINEIMANPAAVADSDGEWFEISNTLPGSVELIGLDVYDLGSDSTTIGTSLVIPGNGFVVLGNNGDQATNGNTPVDYEYSGFTIANSNDEVVIAYGGTVIDEVVYDDNNGWRVWIGTSMNLDPRGWSAVDNDDPVNWCTASGPWGATTDLGSPGAANPQCIRDLDGDGTPETQDCDDNDPVLNYLDEDFDGWASCDGDCDDHDPSRDAMDADGDGWTSCTDPQDCDDSDPIAQPLDEDGDGYTGCDGDCVDDNADVHPGATEIPDNGLDDDCVDGDEVTITDTGTTTGTGYGTGSGTGTGTGTTGTGTDKGCGCATPGGGPGPAVLALIALVGLRRKQGA